MLYPIALGILLGFLTGGRFRNVAHADIRALALPIFSFGLEGAWKILSPHVPALDGWGWLVLSVQYGLLFLFALINFRLWPVLLMAAGTACNFAVIAMNGWRMPVTPAVLQNPAMADLVAALDSGQRTGYFIAREAVPLYPLADILHIPGINMGFASVGDVLLMAGVLGLVVMVMHARPPAPQAAAGRPCRSARYQPRHG